MSSPQIPAKARKNLWILVFCQAILGAQMPLHFAVGGLSGQILAIDKCWATLPISMTVLGSMLTAPWLSNLMQRMGRRPGFLIGVFGSTIGAALNAYALYTGSFYLLLLGSFLIGIYMSAQGFFRFAAADLVENDLRPKAISFVMASGLVSAVFGPQLANLTQDMLAVQFVGAYLAIILVNLVGAIALTRLDIPRPAAAETGAASDRRGYLELARSPRIFTAIVCAMVSYALMNLVMTSTPLAVVGCGYSPIQSNNVVMAHVLGMFVPAFFTGYFISKFGAERVIAVGLVILGGAGAVALSGVDITNFFVALILLGIGWNFGFIGATALLTSVSRPSEQGRIQGMNDFFVFAMVTVASVASGGLMNCSGSSAVEGWTSVNLAMIPFLLLAVATLGWYVFAAKSRAAN